MCILNLQQCSSIFLTETRGSSTHTMFVIPIHSIAERLDILVTFLTYFPPCPLLCLRDYFNLLVFLLSSFLSGKFFFDKNWLLKNYGILNKSFTCFSTVSSFPYAHFHSYQLYYNYWSFIHHRRQCCIFSWCLSILPWFFSYLVCLKYHIW